MSDQTSHSTTHTTHATHATHTAAATHPSAAGKEVKHLAAEEHKAAKVAHKVDSTIYMGQVLASGNPKRIEKYFIRKMAYKLFAKFMGKTVNRI